MGDFMEIGSSNLVPIENGWLLNKVTGEKIDPEGVIYDKEGHVVFDPMDEDDYGINFDPEEYDFLDK